MRRLILFLAASLAACDHITIGPVEPSCPICGGHGRSVSPRLGVFRILALLNL
jgi:hypothetical protein